jgi:hypothetical protein
LVTINPDGSPQVALVWWVSTATDVAGHLDPNQKKLRNIRRTTGGRVDRAPALNDHGLHEYPRAARRRPSAAAPPSCSTTRPRTRPRRSLPMDEPPPGVVTHITVESVGGMGAWTA